MEEIDALLDALWNAAIEGDFEAAIFLQMFAPWAADAAPRIIHLTGAIARSAESDASGQA